MDRGVMAVTVAMTVILAACPVASAQHFSVGADGSANEIPSNFLPGRYFFGEATSYLAKGQVPAAINMLEIAAYWGHKYAQYDLGVIYYNGMGVTADRPLGTAWFGIAAQNHGSLADQTLQNAWQQLSLEERQRASAITDKLMVKYSDTLTRERAKDRFVAEHRKTTGSHLGGFSGSNVAVRLQDGTETDSTQFLAEQRSRLDQTIDEISGRVEIGRVQTIGLDGRPLPQKPDAEPATHE